MYKPGFVSVIMAAYNAEAFLAEAIYGVLNQTYKNFELIIINDGSTDSTDEIIKQFQDARIRYLKNKANKGNHFSRNIALENANGEFVAIMDSDDIALPDWLEKQVHFLQINPEINAVSCCLQLFGNESDKRVLYSVKDPEFVKAFLFFKNCVFQPGILLRWKSFSEHDLKYETLNYIEDYDLWFRSSLKGLNFSALHETLVKYRISPNQESTLYHNQRQENLTKHLSERLRKTFKIDPDEDKLHLISAFISTRIEVNEKVFSTIKEFLQQLQKENKKITVYSLDYFNAALYFFFLRLGKYYYLEHKKQPLQFLKYFAEVVYMLGVKSLSIFLKNRKYL